MSEAITGTLEEFGRQVADAVARGEFERARELTEAAIRLRAGAVGVTDPSDAVEGGGTGRRKP